MTNLPIEKDFLNGLPEEVFADGKGEYRFDVAHETAVSNDSIERNKSVFGNYGWQNLRAFTHFFVDHTGIWQAASLNYQAWGAGQEANPYSVHAELCRREDPEEFKQSYKYYVSLLAWLINRKEMSFERFKTFFLHADVTDVLGGTTHTDPIDYLESHGISVEQFIDDVKNACDGKEVDPKPDNNHEKKETKTNSIVEYLDAHDMDSSFENRSRLADKYDVDNYEGTAEQNLKLLDRIRNGYEKDDENTGRYIHLPDSSSSWRVYPLNVAPTKGNEKGFLNPAKFDGLTYKILGKSQKDVYIIKSGDFGKVQIYGAKSTGAVINDSKESHANGSDDSNSKVYLPASSSSWRIYPTDVAPTTGNEKGFLNPAKFGGLEYEILAKPQPNVVTIKSGDFGKGNIYVAPSTGAEIN